ncbi:DEKNAAC104420 [Brettanomyces naardenensis]|uniref:DEKNAAC104420 n=1 Tax=Brettanomyces naardenensis TaxID=13370 RepID=A0A448YQV3_BRENA|nr:DEKNAAC104420 [Brettanomyces naardenensis]
MSDDLLPSSLFEEPPDFLPPPAEAHFVNYSRTHNSPADLNGIPSIHLRLVGKSPLWGHLLWNAGIYTANYVDSHAKTLIKGKKVVEFGAASALPSLLCCIDGADKVIATDYPDADLLYNINYNVEHLPIDKAIKEQVLKVEGFIWGNDVSSIRDLLDDRYADFIIMSDLVFNHTEHQKLLRSCKELIRPLADKKDRESGGKCLVVWSPHRPKKEMVENDFRFFEDAKENFGFDVEFVEMVHWDHPMFPEDPKESEELRKRVYCYILRPTW